MKLSDLNNKETAVIVKVAGHGGFRRRIMEMGFVRGQKVMSVLNSPLNDPVKYSVMGYELSLRRSEADMVEVLPEEEAEKRIEGMRHFVNASGCGENCLYCSGCQQKKDVAARQKNEINVALVGNPNSGKTSLFNALSGGSEHVGNYSGVTVTSKTGHFTYKGYKFNITDLPGTYSLSAYSPEERYVRQHIFEKMPDVILNAVVASNLERNLYLTTELIDLSQPMVVALNMYDEVVAEGAKLDYKTLGGLIGVPMVPTVAKNGKGLGELLETMIDVFENRDETSRHIHINYGTAIEPELSVLAGKMHEADDLPFQFPPRYWALKMLEKDMEAEKQLSACRNYAEWSGFREKAVKRIVAQLNDDVESAVTDNKYGFIDGAVEETYVAGDKSTNRKTHFIDQLVANKWLGFPIFILLMWLMFAATFQLGAYPQEWIELGFGKLGDWASAFLPNGLFKDLIVNGIIDGVGSVAVFLPNILILYLFISLMEDSGYMARAAFIMDRIMHRMGLHGKSFIPLLMGFGCNVPAIMATRTIESHSSRLITILVNPFIPCNARLPVLILIVGTFFSGYAAALLALMYLFGILVAVVTARLLRKFVFKKDETPFVMELPPYRIPTVRATVKHVWDKCVQYLRKIGGIVLIASVIVWFLSYFPRTPEASDLHGGDVPTTQCENSYLGKIGKFCEPMMRPLGFNWKATIAILSGIPAKEIVVSTLGVLYSNEDEAALSQKLLSSGDFNTASALAFLVFVLLYCPCIATIATIKHESGSWKWAVFSVVYNNLVAWLIAYVVFLAATMFF